MNAEVQLHYSVFDIKFLNLTTLHPEVLETVK